MASSALPPSASAVRPASTAAWCGAATTPRRCPAVWRSMVSARPILRCHAPPKRSIQQSQCLCAWSRVRRIMDRPLSRATTLKMREVDGNLSGVLAQPPPLEQALGRRQAPAEGGVELGRIARAAGGVDMIMQLLRDAGIKDVAGLLERRERVGVEHLRPQIAVVGRGVAGARKYVLEVGGSVTHDDLGRHAVARERSLLEAIDVEGVADRGLEMQVEVDERR